MSLASQVLYVGLFIICGAGTALSVAVRFWPHRGGHGLYVTRAGAVVGVVGLVARSIDAGHLPIFGTFENTWTCAAAILIFCSVAPRLLGGAEDMWRWMVPWSLVFLVFGTQFRSSAVALTISEQSILVDVHVVLAWTAFAALLCAATLSLLRVFGTQLGWTAPLESQRIHDRLIFGGYVAFTAMLAVGAFYLWVLFATLWRWDIVGALSLLAWLLYSILIHVRLFYRWHGLGYHIGALAVLPVLLLAFWVWSLYPGTYHYFDIPLIRPY